MQYKNKFIELNIYNNIFMIEIKWLDETLFMSDDEFIKIAEKITYYVQTYNLKILLNNMKNFKNVLSLRFQSWAKSNFFPVLIKHLKKIAILPPDNYIFLISFKQLFDNIIIKVKTFTKEEEALKWLFNKE